MKYQVIVVGGGLAGLTAALTLAKAGVSVLLLESGEVGGRLGGGPATTITQNGHEWSFPGEHGIHGVWGQYHNFKALLRRENIDPGMIPARREAWIMRSLTGKIQWAEGGSALRKSWIPAPFHYLALFGNPRFLQMLTLRDLASMFRLFGSLLLAIAYDPAVEGVQLEGLTLADFFKGWSPTLQSLFIGLARNFTSANPKEVPQSGFVAFLRFYTLLRRDAWAFHYFNRDAFHALITPLVEKIKAAGGQIQEQSRVTRLEELQNNQWRVYHENGQAESDYVVLALDAPASRELLTSSFPEIAQKLIWPLAVPTVVLRYWFSTSPRGAVAKPESGIFTGNFVIDNYFWLHRFQQPFLDWHAATGGSAVESHIYGPPEILAEPDAILLAKGLLDLQRVWPTLRGTLIGQSIRHNAATHSLFSVGASDAHLGVITPHSTLFACGDWVRYPHPALYMERAAVTGLAASNAILEKLGLPTMPILAVQKPEILVRGFEYILHRIRARARSYNSRRHANGSRSR